MNTPYNLPPRPIVEKKNGSIRLNTQDAILSYRMQLAARLQQQQQQML